ncbi:hypothetical protein AJ87_37250 [Rhizobium yanglingense]|nr:hypothetical protein AJ87_37250 [Rhizobium yanglingense]
MAWYAAMQVLDSIVVSLFARHDQHILLMSDAQIVLREAGHCHDDTIVVLADFTMSYGGQFSAGTVWLAASSAFNIRSKPTLDRKSGEKSKVLLIAISSFEATWIQDSAKPKTS